MITVNEYYKSIFGEKVYKISLDAGCTCPNRDGTKGYGGCIFCSQTGSGDFTPDKQLSITEQIEQAKKLVDSKFCRKNKLTLSPLSGNPITHKYIAYFQNFTNTYGDIKQLELKWEEALMNPAIVGIALGTRPDCITDEVLEVLKKLTAKTFVQVELGLQSSKEETGLFINRCYPLEDYKNAIKKLHEASGKIHIVTHIIFGLPTYDKKDSLRVENKAEMMESVKTAIDSGTNGIKITVLYVIENTKLAEYYKTGKIKTLEMKEYFQLIEEALKIIPNHIIIHRLTGDPPKSLLLAPTWTTDKKRVLNQINTLKQ